MKLEAVEFVATGRRMMAADLLEEERYARHLALVTKDTSMSEIERTMSGARLSADNQPRNARRSPLAIFEIVWKATPKSAAMATSGCPSARRRRISATCD